MLQLDISAYSLSGIPYITYEALDEFAESVIRDFNPENLKAPAILDVAKFVKFYLDMEVEYKRVSYDRKIMAMTAFNTGIVRVYDDRGIETLPLAVQEGTLIIDPVLKEKRNEPRRRFTIMHEASHWMIHRPSFAEGNPFGSPGVFENQYLAAKKGRIDYSRSLSERTGNERIERQADFLSSALLMPKEPLRKAFREFFKPYRMKPCGIVRGRSALEDDLAKLLPGYVAEKFGVSKRAAQIRLEKLGGIIGKQAMGRYALD